MPSRSVPFGVKPRTWSATSSPRKPSMGSPASNPYAPTPRACWIPAANTGVLKTVSTTFATSPLMKIARASAVAQAPRSWPPFAISPYRFSASPELATSPQHFAAVLVRAIPSSFASSGCDFDVAVPCPCLCAAGKRSARSPGNPVLDLRRAPACGACAAGQVDIRRPHATSALWLMARSELAADRIPEQLHQLHALFRIVSAGAPDVFIEIRAKFRILEIPRAGVQVNQATGDALLDQIFHDRVKRCAEDVVGGRGIVVRQNRSIHPG